MLLPESSALYRFGSVFVPGTLLGFERETIRHPKKAGSWNVHYMGEADVAHTLSSAELAERNGPGYHMTGTEGANPLSIV